MKLLVRRWTNYRILHLPMSKNLDIVMEVKLYDMKYSSRNKQLISISEVMMIDSISQSKETGLCLTIVIVVAIVVKIRLLPHLPDLM